MMPVPPSLYRYLSLDATSINWIPELLRGHWKMANPVNFNDPFDCSIGIDTKDFEGNNFEDLVNIVMGIEELDGITSSEIISQYRDAKSINKPYHLFDHVFVDKVRSILNQYRILCFSENWNNIQMWSHYADNHKGVVVEVDPAMFLNTQSQLIKVRYVQNYPSISDVLNAFKAGHMAVVNLVASRKQSGWDYESEWRLIVHHDDTLNDEFIAIGSVIKNIYLGVKYQNRDLTSSIHSQPHHWVGMSVKGYNLI